MAYDFKEKPVYNFENMESDPEPSGGFNLRKIIILAVGIVVLALIVLGIYFLIKSITSREEPAPVDSYDASKNNIIFAVADSISATRKFESMVVSVSNLQIHEEEKGWVNVSGDLKSYDLIDLNKRGVMAFLAGRELDPGSYDQVQIVINKVEITDKGEKKEAKFPSGDIKVFGNFIIGQEGQSVVLFDFATDTSVFVADNETFVFIPNLVVESKSNTVVGVNQNKEVSATLDNLNVNKKVGMDVSGEIKTNFRVDLATQLNMVGNVIKVYVPGDADKSVKITPIMAVNTAVNDGYLDKAVSIKMTIRNNEKAWLVSGLKNSEIVNVYINSATGIFIISQVAKYETCLADVDLVINEFNSCTQDTDCTGIALSCGTRSINSFFRGAFNEKIKDVQLECQILFEKKCDNQARGPAYFFNRCQNKKCVAIPKPVYETQLGDVRFVFQSSTSLGSVLKSTKSYVPDITTTERFIKVTIGVQNKGKGTLPAFTWDLGSIVDSEGRSFAPITTKAYEFLPKPDLCSTALEPEFDLIGCTRMYEVSKISTGLKIEVMLKSPKIEKSLLDLNLIP